jgi:hypothetical protein
MSAVTGPAAGRIDLGPMRDHLQARIDVIKAEVEALEAERTELARARRDATAGRGDAAPPAAGRGERGPPCAPASLRSAGGNWRAAGDGGAADGRADRTAGGAAAPGAQGTRGDRPRPGAVSDTRRPAARRARRPGNQRDRPGQPQAQALAAGGAARRQLTGQRAPARRSPFTRAAGAFGVAAELSPLCTAAAHSRSKCGSVPRHRAGLSS